MAKDNTNSKRKMNVHVDPLFLEVIGELQGFRNQTTEEFIVSAIKSQIKFDLRGINESFPEYVEDTVEKLDIEGV